MKKGWIIVLGILDLIACVLLVVVHYNFWFLEWGVPDAFTWGLPVLIAAVVALICGIFTLIRESRAWAFTGFMIAGSAGIYFWILSWVVSWTMA
jgi:hypothetical protein